MADDIDFDTVEKLMTEDGLNQLQKEAAIPIPVKELSSSSQRELSTKSSVSSSSRRRDRSSSRGRKDTSSRHRHRSRSRSRNRETSRSPARPKRDPAADWEERVRKDEENRKKEIELRRKKEIEEARRDDMTVLVLNLCLKADERDIYEFFADKAGKVRDIQCIKDQRSGKPKGVAYVEFYTQEAVIKALALSGQLMKGQPIRVQASQAEKNRAAKAAKLQQADLSDGPMRLYVGGLVDKLGNITEKEIKQLFVPFGEILQVEIHRDSYTGRSKGYAFIQFQHAAEAREAMMAMNGFEIAGHEIKVGYATDPSKVGLLGSLGAGHLNLTPEALMAHQLASGQYIHHLDSQDTERLDDDGGGLLSGAGSKLALMQKLQRDGPTINYMNSGIASDTGVAGAAAQAKALAGMAMVNGSSAPATPYMTTVLNPSAATANIVLCNMFLPSDVNLLEDPDFFNDIKEDVSNECSKHGTVVQIWMKQTAPYDGKIWVKFNTSDQALHAFTALNGRYFGGQAISAEFVSDSLWNGTCRRAEI